MNEFESRLRDELQSAADRVTASSPLAARARRTARKIRTRRIVASGALVAAATAIAVPAAMSLQDAPHVAPQPAITPSPPTEEPAPSLTPDPSPDPDQTTPEPAPEQDGVTTLELGDLVAGPPPAIPWIDGQVLHDADGHEMRIPGGVFSVASFLEGLVGATINDSPDLRIAFVGAEGELTTYRGLGPVISADGNLVAWYDADAGQLRFAASDGGQTPDAIDVAEPLAPVGFAGPDALIVNVGTDPFISTGVRRYDLSDGSVTDLPADLLGAMTVSQSGLVFGYTEQLDFDSCSAMFSFDAEEPLWDTCEFRFHHFSPDGQYVLGVHINSDGIGASSVFVVDATTGDLVHRFDASGEGYIGSTAFEDDGTVLLVYTSSSNESEAETAIVRCSFEGSCEAATEVRDLPEDDPALEQRLFGLGLQP